MIDNNWQDTTLTELKDILQAKGVLLLSVGGSLAQSEITKDKWSDIDALVVVKDDFLEDFFPSLEWLKTLGEIFTFQISDGEQKAIKVIFKDFRKVEMVITTEASVKESVHFLTKQKVVFSKSDDLRQIIEEKSSPSASPDLNNYDLNKLANDYWFTSFVAVTKVIRNDLLIALHLALDLYRYCLLLSMWLRDKETGTYIHRIGGIRNDDIEKMGIKLEELSKEGILSLIEKSGKEFDNLALEWSSEYTPHSPVFKNALDQARKDI